MQCINREAIPYALVGVVITANEDIVEWYHEADDRSVRRHLSRPNEMHRVGEVKLARKDLIK